MPYDVTCIIILTYVSTSNILRKGTKFMPGSPDGNMVSVLLEVVVVVGFLSILGCSCVAYKVRQLDKPLLYVSTV